MYFEVLALVVTELCFLNSELSDFFGNFFSGY